MLSLILWCCRRTLLPESEKAQESGTEDMAGSGRNIPEHRAEASIAIWKEALCGVDLCLLHTAPAYYGLDVPRGNGSAVVLIPGFLTNDAFLRHLYSWLERIGYRPYRSGIGLNAECPNLLIKRHVTAAIKKAVKETGRRVHLIGHSLGGIIARSLAVQRPDDIASVIMLGSPFRGTVVHPEIWHVAERVRKQILERHGRAVFSNCYTPQCSCDFSKSLRRKVPRSVGLTAIYTRNDGIVDWRYCVTGDSRIDCEVSGTHIGLPFNASVYATIAARLSEVQSRRSVRSSIAVSRARRKQAVDEARHAASKRNIQNACATCSSPVMPIDLPVSNSSKETSVPELSAALGMTLDGMPGEPPILYAQGAAILPVADWNRIHRAWLVLKQRSRHTLVLVRQGVERGRHTAMVRLSTLARRLRGEI